VKSSGRSRRVLQGGRKVSLPAERWRETDIQIAHRASDPCSRCCLVPFLPIGTSSCMSSLVPRVPHARACVSQRLWRQPLLTRCANFSISQMSWSSAGPRGPAVWMLVLFPVRIGHRVLVDAGDALRMPSRSKRRLPRIAALAPFLRFMPRQRHDVRRFGCDRYASEPRAHEPKSSEVDWARRCFAGSIQRGRAMAPRMATSRASAGAVRHHKQSAG
jgi:hypothetical protein